MKLYQYKGKIIERQKFSDGFFHLMNLLEHGELKFTNPSEFNDPFDCCPTHVSEAPDDAFPHAVGSFINETMRSVFSVRHGIACLTPHPDSMLMWSHYGDQHKSVCIGFDAELLLSQAPKNNKGNSLFDRIIKVDYTEQRPGHDSTEMYCQKSIEWSYENEYRIISSMKRGIPAWGPGIWKISKHAIKELIIGAQVPDKFRKIIHNSVKAIRPDIEVKLAILHMNQFKLLIESYHDQPIVGESSGYVRGPNDDWIPLQKIDAARID